MATEEDLKIIKLELEIEELRCKIVNSKNNKIWDDFTKPLLPILATLILTFVGLYINYKFNLAQQINTESKNKADKEIAQINASLSYIKLMAEIPKDSTLLKQSAKTIIAPALPIESSFFIAINELQNNPNVLEVLCRTYKNDYWKFLVPFLEENSIRTDNEKPNWVNSLPIQTNLLFTFLDKRQMLNDFYQFVISKDFNTKNRIYAIKNYLAYLKQRKDINGNITGLSLSEKKKLELQLFSTIEATTDETLKADISKAAAIIFENNFQGEFTEIAAKYFWANFDVGFAETPTKFSMDQYIYDERFHKKNQNIQNNKQIDTLLSNSLYSKLSKLNFKSFEVTRTHVILYSYCEQSGYLIPNHILKLMETVLQSLTEVKKKEEFAEYLDSSDEDLFGKFAPYTIEGEGMKYANLLIEWYKANSKATWKIPKFFCQMVDKYPGLKTKIDRLCKDATAN